MRSDILVDKFTVHSVGLYHNCLKPNSITLASSELAPNMLGASSELASVMEFGFYMRASDSAVAVDNARVLSAKCCVVLYQKLSESNSCAV